MTTNQLFWYILIFMYEHCSVFIMSNSDLLIILMSKCNLFGILLSILDGMMSLFQGLSLLFQDTYFESCHLLPEVDNRHWQLDASAFGCPTFEHLQASWTSLDWESLINNPVPFLGPVYIFRFERYSILPKFWTVVWLLFIFCVFATLLLYYIHRICIWFIFVHCNLNIFLSKLYCLYDKFDFIGHHHLL